MIRVVGVALIVGCVAPGAAPDAAPPAPPPLAPPAAAPTNQLAAAHSPYLRQHADNPVAWQIWGDAAFALAKRLDRPVLLSVGYSTCHWCHVMERESFEDEEVAAFLNANFVAVKVDREERPDVDAVYMSAVYALAGRGGWPMTVVLTPDRQPFFAGTYFPRDRFLSALRQLASEYRDKRGEVVDRAAALTARLQAEAAPKRPSALPGREVIVEAARGFAERFDPRWGGFGGRPKFPRPAVLAFLLRYHRRTGDRAALHMVLHTLRKMAAGGIYDHVGGGFHRYSTDGRWLVPHFEKMLYDNAQLAMTYMEAWQITGEEALAKVARETLDYVGREMTHPKGGFYSATDADSEDAAGHHHEGLFFTWTPAELRGALGAADALVVGRAYGVTERGNFEGRTVLHRWTPVDEEASAVLERARPKLHAARATRRAPLRDDKVLTAWSALMVSAYARAWLALRRPEDLARAQRGGDFLLTELRGADGRLRRSYIGGQARIEGYAQDYAFAVAALLDLHEATGAPRWFDAALALQARLDALYSAPGGGYHTTAKDAEALLVRAVPDYDGALPSANSVAALNLLRLAELTGEARHREAVARLLAALGGALRRGGQGAPMLLSALEMYLDAPREVVVVTPDGDRADALSAVLARAYLPNRVLVLGDAAALGAQAKRIPLLEAKVARDGRATAYVCERGVCELPTSDPEVFAAQLARVRPLLPDRSPEPLPSR